MQKGELDIKLDESVFWTGSTTVLRYIFNETKRFHTFVGNRISVISHHSHLLEGLFWPLFGEALKKSGKKVWGDFYLFDHSSNSH